MPGVFPVTNVCATAEDVAADASTHFSERILPYVKRLVSGQVLEDEIASTLQRAKIIDKGRMTAEHSWLAPRVEAWRKTEVDSSDRRPAALPTKKKRVLLLGSGLVAGPAVDVFVARRDIELVIGGYKLRNTKV